MPTKKIHTKLNYCDIKECEGICCSDGAFLLPEEARRIKRIVAKHPEHFAHLPADYIIDGEWYGQEGPKTNVRPHRYRAKPAHFKNTRCVMADDEGKCTLQTLAVAQGKHKWTYKPMGCWLFPLSTDPKLIPPPRTRKEDPNNLGKDYPGFSIYTPCGKHDPKGKVWWIALKEEVKYLRDMDD
jgi:hypothetical protein